jgi:hypothetical protein
MRIVVVALLALVCLIVPEPLIADSLIGAEAAQETVPESDELSAAPSPLLTGAPAYEAENSPFHNDQFVYVPPPPSKAVDPRFHSDSFEFLPGADGSGAGVLIQPQYGVIPVKDVKAKPTSYHAPSAAPVPTSTKPKSDDASDSATSKGQISPGPTVVSTPTPSATSKSSDAVSKTATPKSPSATINGQIDGKIKDIEDPRFYRGSYVYDPDTRTLLPGMIDAPPSVPGKSTPHATPGCRDDCTPPAGRGDFPRTGRAMYYNPGIMEQVLAFRLEAGHVAQCYECVGYVALLDAKELNRKVWIEWGPGDVEGPFLVIDAAAKHHVASLLERNWVIDVDYQTAMRRGMNRPLPVTVWDHRPDTYYSSASK